MGIFRSTNPLVFDDVDGIIINETAPAPGVQGVPANIAILVGVFQRGAKDALVQVNSIGDFHEKYGKADFSGNDELKNKKFGTLKVIRATASDSVKASLTLQDITPANSLKFEALYEGAYGNLLKVTVENGTNSGKKYTIKDTNPEAVLTAEVYDDVVSIGKDQAALDKIFGTSKLVKPVSIPAVAEPVNVADQALASGVDGSIADTDYQSAIAAAEQERSGNVLWLDAYNSVRRAYLKTHTLNAPDKLVILAPDDVTKDKSVALVDVALNRDTEGAIIYAFNPIETVIDGVKQFTGPASWLASIISNTAPSIDPAWSQNANLLLGGLSVKFKLTRNDYIQLKDAGIAAFEQDPDIGLKLKSGVTTQIANSSKLTILRRRMAYFLTDSVALFLKNFQNAPNTKALGRDVAGAVIAFDDSLINDGILPGDNEVSDGKARLIDAQSLNTDASIAAGFFKLLYKRRIFSSARFIVLQAEIGESVVVTEA